MKTVYYWPVKCNLNVVLRAQIILGYGLGVQLIDLTSARGIEGFLGEYAQINKN